MNISGERLKIAQCCITVYQYILLDHGLVGLVISVFDYKLS
jgi:hypothetical protein